MRRDAGKGPMHMQVREHSCKYTELECTTSYCNDRSLLSHTEYTVYTVHAKVRAGGELFARAAAVAGLLPRPRRHQPGATTRAQRRRGHRRYSTCTSIVHAGFRTIFVFRWWSDFDLFSTLAVYYNLLTNKTPVLYENRRRRAAVQHGGDECQICR